MKSPQEDQYQAAKSINYSKVSSCNSIWIIQIERRLARNKRTRHASHASSIELLFEGGFCLNETSDPREASDMKEASDLRDFYLRLLFEASEWGFWIEMLWSENCSNWNIREGRPALKATGARLVDREIGIQLNYKRESLENH